MWSCDQSFVTLETRATKVPSHHMTTSAIQYEPHEKIRCEKNCDNFNFIKI